MIMRPISTTYRWSALRSLVALAVLSLAASIPAFGQVLKMVYPEDGAVLSLSTQYVVVEGWSGFDAELRINGSAVETGKMRPDGKYDFFNVQMPSGPVEVEVRLLNPDGSQIASVKRSVHVLGDPAHIRLALSQSSVPANGSSIVDVEATVFDAWMVQIRRDLAVTVTTDSAEILTPDLDKVNRGVQVPVFGGVATFSIRAIGSPGKDRVTVELGAAKETAELRLTTPLEPFSLVGLAEGGVHSLSLSGDRTRLGSASTFVDGTEGNGRVAVFARGTVFDEYLLTASLDTDRRNRQRYFREVDPDYLYAIMGDNSMLYYDAQTNRNFFLKLEKDQSSLYLGDYNTDLTQQEFTLYNRTLNGAKIRHRDEMWDVTAFGSLTDRRVSQVEQRGQGISGFYSTGATRITYGSDKVRLETRDLRHSEVVLKRQELYRFADYEIDYEQGTVFFKQPVPSIDAAGNPVWIVFTFEAPTGGDYSYVAGGRVARSLGDYLTVGVTGVTEEQAPTNYSMLGGDVAFRLGTQLAASGEVARSSSLNGDGLAYKVDVSGSPVDGLKLNSYYRRVENGFENTTQSGGGREVGTIKFGAGAQAQPWEQTRVMTDAYRSYQSAGGGMAVITSATGAVEHKFMESLSGRLKVEDLDYRSPDSVVTAQDRHSTLLSAGATYAINRAIRLTAEHERNLSTGIDPAKPNATSLIGEWRATDWIVLSLQQKWFEDGGSTTTMGASSTIAEGTEAYGRYEIGNGTAGYRNMASVGLKNRLPITEALIAHLAVERTKNLGTRVTETPTQDNAAISAALEFLPKEEPIKASAKVEVSQSSLSDRFNLALAGDYRFQRDLSAIVKFRLGRDASRSTDGYQDQYHLITGLAYRPVDHNVVNLLAKMEVKGNKNHYIAPFLDYQASIASMHAYVEPVRRVELGIKYAFKVAEESSPALSVATHSHFILLRADYDLTEAISVGGEFRSLWQAEAGDRLDGYSLDLGYALMKNVRLTTGYNFKGYYERDLVSASLSNHGPFIGVHFKFDESLFGLE